MITYSESFRFALQKFKIQKQVTPLGDALVDSAFKAGAIWGRHRYSQELEEQESNRKGF